MLPMVKNVACDVRLLVSHRAFDDVLDTHLLGPFDR
jgi:hypothetical protein